MRHVGAVHKSESVSVLVAVGIHQSLRNKLAAEKRRLRQAMRAERALRRYRFDLS